MKGTECETIKVNLRNLLRGREITAGLIGQWFEKLSLVNKKGNKQ